MKKFESDENLRSSSFEPFEIDCKLIEEDHIIIFGSIRKGQQIERFLHLCKRLFCDIFP